MAGFAINMLSGIPGVPRAGQVQPLQTAVVDMNDRTIALDAASRLSQARKAFATRRVCGERMVTLITGAAKPAPGDLVLARIQELGHHRGIELENGRKAKLFVGDEVILAYGNRYAPDQFEALLPESLGPCEMVAAGGLAARAVCRHAGASPATKIEPIGLVGDAQGVVLNLADFALREPAALTEARPYTVAVAGTSMNAGKTETATHLIRALRDSGLKVGAAKVTGTGAGGDLWSMLDAGAFPVLDFTDAGVASTYLASGAVVERVMRTLLAHLRKSEVDVIVLEIADGLLQPETSGLLRSSFFAENVDGIVFAASDSLGAAAGVDWLRSHSLPVLAVSGVLSVSPLAMREAQAATGLPVFASRLLDFACIERMIGTPLPRRGGLLQAAA